MKKKYVLIGISGLAASGKSLFSEILRKKGYIVIDLDKIGHYVLNSENISKKITQTFGKEVLDNGKISRKKLGKIVFSDKKKLNKLSFIIWPEMKKELSRIIELIKNNLSPEIFFLEAAVLFEGGFDEFTDFNVWVDAKREIRKKRLINRNGEEIANRVIYSQKHLEYGKSKSDYIIENNGNKDELIKKTEDFLQKIKNDIRI